jgi:translocation and assembly module TamB
MDEQATPPPAAAAPGPAPRPRRSRRRRLTLFGLAVVLMIAAVAGVVGTLFWAAGNPAGSSWLLARLSSAGIGVQVIEPEGIVLGDLKAKQVIVTQGGTRIVIDRPVWKKLRARYTPYPETWVALHAESLSAERVTITTEKSRQPPDGKPFALPRTLRLPLELTVDDLQVGELLVPGLEGRPMRDVRGKVELGADQGRVHRVDVAGVRLDPLLVTGKASLGTDTPFPLEASLQAVQGSATPPTGVALPGWAKPLDAGWQAQLAAKGPLGRFDLQATVRAQGQSLDATAQVAMADAWPLPRLQATTQGLDLAALLQHAPTTALSGSVSIAPTGAAGDKTLAAQARLVNARPGRWDTGQLPVRTLSLDARGRSDQLAQLELGAFDLVLSDGRKDAGQLKGSGRVDGASVELQAEVTQLQPSALDPRMAAMTLSGPLSLKARPAPADAGEKAWPSFEALVDLKGRLNSPSRPVQLKLDAVGNDKRIELRELRAATGETHATLKAEADRAGDAWQLKAQSALVDFDPRPWFPAGPGGGWQAGNHSLNLTGNAKLTLPDTLWAAAVPAPAGKPATARPEWLKRAVQVHGDATAALVKTELAGVAMTGDLSVHHTSAAEALEAKASLDVAGNRLKAEGQLATDTQGTQDSWSAEVRAPVLARLAPLIRILLTPEQANELLANFSGSLDAEARLSGRWPFVKTQGKAELTNLRAGTWSVGQAGLTWQAGTAPDAPLDVDLAIGQAAWDKKQLGPSSLQLKGTPRAHTLNLRGELKAAPPVWVEGLQGKDAAAAGPAASAVVQAVAQAAAETNGKAAPPRTLALLSAQGGVSGGLFSGTTTGTPPPIAWKGTLQQLELRTTQAGTAPLLVTRDVGLEFQGGEAARVGVTAGRADILGAGLRWNRIDWVAGQAVQTQQLDMQAELEPLAVAPLLRRVQPNFGWGGDLEIGGKVVIRQTDRFSADIVLERRRGDLTVTEEGGTQSLGLTDLRIGLDAQDGVWNFTAGLAGKQLGVLGGALVVRTSPNVAWPSPNDPVQGVLEAQVANLGTWGPWVPAGWRLDGKLQVSASLGGKFSAPEYTGEMRGSGIGVRNMLEGVNLTDGEVDISLRGDTAKINKFTAKGGNGTVRVEGDARLDNGWRSRLTLVAENFQLLGRVDLRIVTTGQAQVVLENEAIKADGKFTVDEGLVDFTRLSSPSLSEDVVVTGRSAANEQPPAPGAPATSKMTLNLLVNLGHQLRMRGLGIDTRLQGELKVTLPNGKWALQGTVNAVDGTFANYGQKLVIDRGVINFNGAPSDMRLDIEATRPNLDVRVGVAVTGPLANLRVRLFSEPEMTQNEKLSWLLLGRASDGLGRSDAALLQRAAFALLAGDGDGGPGQITKAIGIDDVGIRQNDVGDTKETVVAVGKQVSRRVYVAYEQNLNTASGSFQVTYRIAQRFVMRLQSGLDRSIDLIGTWRWE